MEISENVKKILSEIPPSVSIVAAAKGRTSAQIVEAIDSGIKIIGENYLQDSVEVFPKINQSAEWHFIGHLQKNKVKKALEIFSCIQSVDSLELAEEIDKRAKALDKKISIFIEINIGNEASKFGVRPENAIGLFKKISALQNVSVQGLMAMEPLDENPESSRPYFQKLKKLFEEIKAAKIQNIEMKFLSMGMTNSYRIAIAEGSNMVRIGRKIFE